MHQGQGGFGKRFLSFVPQLLLFFISSDSVDVDSLGQDSSDEEEEEEEEGRVARVTSIDEALRTVTGAADRSQEAFLKRNFETLAESCNSGRRGQTLTCNFKGIV